MAPAPEIAVVGGGVSGLAAAHRARTLLGERCRITVYEASDRLGGKLRTVPVGGVAMDVGAEAFLARRPEVPALLAELGLAGEVVHPAGAAPRLRSGGSLHPVPKGTLMGVPADPGALAGLLGADAAAAAVRADGEPMRWERGGDRTVGALVTERYGAAVVRRCVDPLLGGVYSGSADTIGVRAALPALAEALDAGAASLGGAVRAALDAGADRPAGPVFGALAGGYTRLVEALAAAGRAWLRTGCTVGSLRRDGGRWALGVTDEDGVHEVHADAVVLAVDAVQTARLLGVALPAAAEAAGRIPLADSAVVAVALGAGTALPEASGVLVAADEPGVHAKACTLSSRKWPHLAPAGGDGPLLLRLSYGRYGASRIVWRSDAELIACARSDLRTLLCVTDEPVEVRVQRWRGGLPQYGAGHASLVGRVEESVAAVDGLAVAGSAWHGVGVPACVGGARAAAESVAAGLAG